MKQPKVSVIVTYYNCENTIYDFINSILNQSFNDIEIICVNSGSTDNSEKIILDLAQTTEKIRLISLPNNNDLDFAKQTGLGVASSDFVIFLNTSEVIDTDFIKNKFFELTQSKIKNIKNNHLYRRAFLENDTEITTIIQNELDIKLEESAKKIKEQKAEIRDEFNKFYQNNVETIKNNSYEIICRFNQLEKLFYEKDYEYKTQIDNFIKNAWDDISKPTQKVYEDITKIYEHISSEINKKGSEINAIYEEITKNYHYTEEIVDRKTNEMNTLSEEKIASIWKKLSDLEREIVVRYVNLKRVIDLQLDELSLKIQSGNSTNTYDDVSIERVVSENLDKIYSRLNESSTLFYEELSKIYKDLNENLRKQKEEERYFFEQKLNDLRNEFDTKLQSLKNEIIG